MGVCLVTCTLPLESWLFTFKSVSCGLSKCHSALTPISLPHAAERKYRYVPDFVVPYVPDFGSDFVEIDQLDQVGVIPHT